MASEFSKIVKVLAGDDLLLQSRLKFSQELGIPVATVRQLLNNYIQGVVTSYDLIYGILREWIQIKGDSATLAELQRILKVNDWNFCSDKLSQIEKLQPGPILSPDASTSDKSNFTKIPSNPKSKPEIEPFGFGNVVPNFTGRDEEMSKLSEYFHSDTPIVLLTGLGGIGKTQLAMKFALDINQPDSCGSPPHKKHKISSSTQTIKSLLRGENAHTLRKSITKFCKRLGLPLKDGNNEPYKVEKMLKKIKKTLKATMPVYKWLVVIDNVDEIYDEFKTAAKTLCSFSTQIFLLVTSRRRDIFAGEVTHFPLSPLKILNSIQFVKKSLGITDDNIDEFIQELCEQLGNFPLALEQATAYIKKQQATSLKGEGFSVNDYLDLLKKQETVGLGKERELSEYQWSTLKVWNITFDKITTYGEEGIVALKVLDMLAFLNPDDGALYLLHGIFLEFYGDVGEVEEGLSLLLKYSLINIENDTLKIHRLVQLAVRERMKSEDLSKPVKLLTQYWTNADPTTWDLFDVNYGVQIWEHSSKFGELDEIRASKFHAFVDVMQGSSYYT